MMPRFALSRLKRDQRGATILEFGFVAPVFCLMLMGGMDVAYSIYIRTIASGTLEHAARTGSLEGATPSQIRSAIRANIYNILPNNARTESNVVIETKSYTDYSRIDAAEKITVDNDNDGVVDSGDCWIDEDANNEYGTNEGLSGMGGSDDSVYYNVDITYNKLFPFYKMVGMPQSQTLTVKTLVINQPYGTQASRPQVCQP
jgi:Flp pilus assembly pilin Flp